MEEPQGNGKGGVPTIRDVARLAGVSHMTVSRVINRENTVRGDMRRKVELAIRELRFVPNPAARALSAAEHVRIALLHRYPNPGPLGEVLIHLVDELARSHASLIVRKLAHGAEPDEMVRDLVDDGVRAAILAPPLADDATLVDLLHEKQIVAVAMGAIRSERNILSVGIDERAAARDMTRHLISLGHRRIGFIKGDPTHASTELRLAGHLSALRDSGITIDPSLVVEGRYTYYSGLDAAEDLLKRASAPSAIFASNDDMAAAVVAVAHRRGIDVPADLSVCGFDDTHLATTMWPELTTVRQPMLELIRATMELMPKELHRARAGLPATGARAEFPHLLIRRQSDAPPRRRPGALPVDSSS